MAPEMTPSFILLRRVLSPFKLNLTLCLCCCKSRDNSSSSDEFCSADSADSDSYYEFQFCFSAQSRSTCLCGFSACENILGRYRNESGNGSEKSQMESSHIFPLFSLPLSLLLLSLSPTLRQQLSVLSCFSFVGQRIND